ncbi:MAG: hypothetical protein ABW000_00130 [Actinoplanes sp.]
MRRGKLFGLVMAVLAGSVLSAVAVHLSAYPGPPSEQAAVAAATTAMGRPPLDTPGPVVVCDFWCPELGSDNVVSYDAPADRTDVVAVRYLVADSRASEVEAAARSRLTAAGWQPSADETLLRDGLRLTLQISNTPSGVDATIVAAKPASWAAVVLAVAGFALGAGLAWPAVAAARRRYHRHGPAIRGSVAVLAAVVSLLTLLWAAPLALLLGGIAAHNGWTPKDVQLAEFVLTARPWVAPATVVVLAAALILLLLPPRWGRFALRLTPQVGQTH